MAIAADMQSAADLVELAKMIGHPPTPVLFVAEVSMTYMQLEAVNSVLEWACSFAQGLSARRNALSGTRLTYH